MPRQAVKGCFENESRRWQWENLDRRRKAPILSGSRFTGKSGFAAAVTTTNAFLAFPRTPLIVDRAVFGRNSMQKSLRTVVIVVLSIGLLALFLRGAHLDVVWTEIRLANRWLIALSAAVTVHDDGAARAAVAVPARADRPRAVRAGVSHDDDRICRERGAAGACRRGDSPLPAGAAGRAERDRDVRHDHHRAAARCGDLRHVARVVRVVLRSGHGPGGQPVVLAWSKSAA